MEKTARLKVVRTGNEWRCTLCQNTQGPYRSSRPAVGGEGEGENRREASKAPSPRKKPVAA